MIWQSIPSERGPGSGARYLLDWRTIIFALILVLVSLGMLSSPPQWDAQADDNVNMSQDQFNAGYQNAQNNGWQTGSWGTAPWYIDGNENMYVGSGQLQGSLLNTVGNVSPVKAIHTLNFTGNVQAPQDSSRLLSASEGLVDMNYTLTNINGLSHLDTSQATDMSNMFEDDAALTNLDLSNWDVSHVQNMYRMFWSNFGEASDNNSLQSIELSDWDTHNVQNMSEMFSGDYSLRNIDVSHWNTSHVTNTVGMFIKATSLTDLDLSHWDTSHAQTMSAMFYNTNSLSHLNLAGWDTSHANLSNSGIFDVLNSNNDFIGNDSNLQELNLGSKTNLHNLDYLPGYTWSNGQQYFSNAELNDGNPHSGDWKITPFSSAFQQAQNNGWQTGYWGNAPYYIDNDNNMYIGSGQLSGKLSDVIGLSTSQSLNSVNFKEPVQAPQDSSSLLGASPGSNNNRLTAINGLSQLDTSHTTDMSTMFASDYNVAHLDGMNDWDTSNVKDMHGMFYGTDAVKDLNVSHWDTSQATDMNTMFWYDSSLSNLNLSGWNTSNVDDMQSMFSGDISLQGLNISSLNTNNVNNMNGIYNGDNALSSITLGGQTKNTPLADTGLVNTRWQNGNQVLSSSNLQDNNAHSGTWNIDSFMNKVHAAQDHGQQTGYWGTAPYYIDSNMDMHIGAGQLNGPLDDIVGNNTAHNISSIDLDENVQAPQNGFDLFSGRNYHEGEDTDVNYSIHSINGLDRLDVSHTTNFHDMFYRDVNLSTPMNIDNWDTSHVNDMGGMFGNTNIPSFDIHDWNVSNNTTTGWMFFNDYTLHDLNLDNWHTDSLDDSDDTFSGDMNLKTLNLQNFKTGSYTNSILFGMDGQIYTGPAHNLEQMTLGNNTHLNERGSYFPGATWTNGHDLLSRNEMNDGNPHPGTWYLTPFAKNYRYARQHGWQTGTWGTAPWYIDPNMNMHIGKGDLQGSLNSVVPNDRHHLQSISIDEPVRAPQDSTGLFAETAGFMDNDYTLQTIQGLDKVDTSQTTNMNAMFYNDTALNHLDVSHWDTSHVQNFTTMFTSDNNLTDLSGINDWNVSQGQNFTWMFYGAPWSNLDLSHWQTPSANTMEAMFEDAGNLSYLNLSNFDTTHAKTTHMFGNDTNYHLPSDNIHDLVLGNKTALQNDAGLAGGIWGSSDGFQDSFQLMDGQSHPGEWDYHTVQDVPDISGTTDDSLNDLLGHALQLPDNGWRLQIINDQGVRDAQGHLKEGNYPNITFAQLNAQHQINLYRTSLSVHRYVTGPDLRADVGQDSRNALSDSIRDATHDNANSIHIDDDGGSTQDGTHLQYGDYTIKYHYQDDQQDWHYDVSPLHVVKSNSVNYLYVNPNDTTPSDNDYMSQVAQFLGIDPQVIRLTGDMNLNSSAGYEAHDGDQDFAGNIRTVPGMDRSLTMSTIPGASDSIWDTLIEKQFANDSAYGLNVTADHIDSFTTDSATGAVEIKGTVHPVNTNFANDPTIPYDFHIHPPMVDYSIDNTVNDRQVQDVLNTIGNSPRVVKVTDGNGADVTGSFGELSTIPQNSNVTVTADTGHGYVNVHFAHISSLIEPNVDITHDSATSGADISNDDLQGQIMSQAHESALDNFSIDNSQMVSPNVKEIDYHFTKDTVATGSSLDIKTAGNPVSGTAYVHYTNDDTSNTPNFTVIQGSNPVQHIEDMTGHTVRITQAPNDNDINGLPVGEYGISYQYTDVPNDEWNTNFYASLTVIPDYYFSPVTNDTHFNSPNAEAGYFRSNDYQSNGSAYKSVVDTQDYAKEDSNNQQDESNDNTTKQPDSTVDGLHTTDGKPAHFDSNNPYNK